MNAEVCLQGISFSFAELNFAVISLLGLINLALSNIYPIVTISFKKNIEQDEHPNKNLFKSSNIHTMVDLNRFKQDRN